jgi:tetratricopeptide (TPR) repeat protein
MPERVKHQGSTFSLHSHGLLIARWILRSIGFAGFVISVVWFLTSFSFEAALSLLACLSAFVASFITQPEQAERAPMPIESSLPKADYDPPEPPPRRIANFVTRLDDEKQDYVELIRHRLAADLRSRITIWGEGGAGKTTLVNEVIQAIYPLPFSGGVFWINTDSYPDFDISSLVDYLLVALDHSQLRQLPLALKEAELFALMAKMLCLVVLDNFETIGTGEQTVIVDSLQDAPFALLVTSRAPFPYGDNLRLGPMSTEEALQFLRTLAGSSTGLTSLRRVSFEDIAQVAAFNPLLMKWALSQLELAISPQDVLNELSAGRGEAADRIFGRSFALLQQDSQVLVLTLALFVPDAADEHLMAACKFDKRRFMDAVREAARLRLIERDTQTDRLTLPPLTHRLATARLREDSRGEGLQYQFVAYFVSFAGDHSLPTPANLDILERELGNLSVAVEYSDQAKDWKSMKRLVSIIADPHGLLNVRGHWDMLVKYALRAVSTASQMNDQAGAAQFLYLAAWTMRQRGEGAEAEKLLSEAAVTQQGLGDSQSMGRILSELGRIAYERGKYVESRRLCAEGLDAARCAEDQANVGFTLHTLGWLARDQGEESASLAYFQEETAIWRRLGDVRGVAGALRALGRLAQDDHNFDDAKKYLNEALAIQRDLQDQSGVAWVLYELARLDELSGQSESACRLYQDSLTTFREARNYYGIGWSLQKLGELHTAQGSYELAEQSLEESQSYFRKIGEARGLAWTACSLGRLYYETERFELARDSILAGLELFRGFGDQRGIAAASDVLSLLPNAKCVTTSSPDSTWEES